MSKVYALKAAQRMAVDINTAWDFFSNPENLNAITPKNIGFKIIGDNYGKDMYAGQIIEYKVKPLLGIPLYWMTEITYVKHQEYFVDEQRFGPYSLWHHQHHFRQINNGIEMTDIVHYKIPFWFVGDAANTLFVKNQLKKIFEFRFNAVEDKFGKWQGDTCVVSFK
ncbi:MAG: SRPBCC family protein [Parafilimonas sp.]